MEKKHKNRFSVVFNEIDVQQSFAIDILNSLPHRTLALYIAQAICAYEHGAKSAPKRVKRTPTKTQEKRNIRGQNESLPANDSESTSNSLSHIKKDPKSPENPQSELNERSVVNPKGKTTVNPDMLGSMMAFVGKDC